jgi:membrane-bound metal-dependent hydrolase YbcI (DUF457 family)
VSWAAHEFENYFIQKHVGTRASFLAIAFGTLSPDLFTKALVYSSDDPAQFHRGWPGVGFTHSLIFGVALAAVVLWLTRSRSWALGVLIGQWAHVVTDIADTAGVMPFFPFATEPFTISMWKHAAVEGRYGDASAYYSSLGGAWDLFWLVVLVVFARNTLRRDYFRDVIVRADPRAWGWLARHLRLGEEGLLLLYRGLVFYGIGRMVSWFLYARLFGDVRWDPSWGGPVGIAGNDLSPASWVEMVARTSVGGVLFAAFLWVVWRAVGRGAWARAATG